MTIPLGERVTDWIATHPAGLLGRIAALRHGFPRGTDRQDVAVAPTADTRVLIGPANYAGQGHLWARALERVDESIAARAYAVESAYGFAADALVSPRVFQNSPGWQRAQLDAARGFSHLLVESVIPPFGRLAGRDLRRQLDRVGQDVSVAFVCHGTDVRSTARPPGDLTAPERRADRIAQHNRSLLHSFDRPVFVTTPDLLNDIPDGIWLPVVVEAQRWSAPEERTSLDRVRVVHAPSSSAMKGSALIEPVAHALHAEGVIEYQPLHGLAHSSMPAVIGAADIVLDQFLLGSYGVAACEAMAAARVVVGHVTEAVRERVLAETGRTLPIVEATSDTLDAVLRRLASDADARREIGEQSQSFVRAVHDGRLSADILMRNWITADVPPENSLT